MRSSYLLFVFSFIFILVNSGYAFDVEINGQMYRLSPVAKYSGTVGDSTYYAEWHVIAAQPWYGNESLAESLKNQVGSALTINGEAPGFVYRRNGPSLYFYYYPYSSAYGGLYHFVKATLLIDTDGDGSYDLDDLDDDNDGLTDEEELIYGTNSLLVDSDENGINDLLEVFQIIKAQKAAIELERDARPTQNSYDLVVAERDARPTQAALDAMIAERDARPTQASYDVVVAERDARPTQAALDAMIAERDASIEQFSTLNSRVNEILPKAVPNAPSFDLDNFNISFNLGKNLLEQSKDYQFIHDYYNYAEWKIGQVESRIAEGEFEEAVMDIDDLIDEVTSSPLTYEVPYDFSQVREKFVAAKGWISALSFDLDNFNISFNLGKNLLEQSKDYQFIHDYYNYAEWKIGQVESRIAEGEFEEAVMDIDDLIDEVTSSPLTYEVPYDFSQVREKFENSKSKLVSFNVLKNAYDPTPVPTATLEEYIISLNSDLTSAREERDNKLSMEEVRDMKLKSRMMQVDGGSASLNITLEATDNLGITSPTWSPISENKVVIHPEFQNGKIRIDIEGDDDTNTGTKFYRFKMND